MTAPAEKPKETKEQRQARYRHQGAGCAIICLGLWIGAAMVDALGRPWWGWLGVAGAIYLMLTVFRHITLWRARKRDH